MLRRAVVPENFVHHGVFRDDLELLMEVILILVSPSVDIVGLNIDLEGPVRVLFLLAELIEFSQLHDRHSTSVSRYLSQVFTNRLSCAVVVHLSEDIGPSVPEEVEGGLAIEGKHSEPVCGSHSISEELHSVARSGLRCLGGRLRKLRDPTHSVLAASEDASVRSVESWDELQESSDTTGVCSLYPIDRHGVRDCVEGEVHILLEEALELLSNEESLRRVVPIDSFPDHLRLAVGRLGLVLWGV